MRVMGIDYGDARTGIALSDLLCSIVGSTTVIHSRNMDKTLEEVVRIVKENQVTEICIGLPKNMDGSEGFRAEACKEFADILGTYTGIPVVLRDERLTTVSAHKFMNMNDVRGKKRKNTVDAVAAVIILEDYIAFRKNHR